RGRATFRAFSFVRRTPTGLRAREPAPTIRKGAKLKSFRAFSLGAAVGGGGSSLSLCSVHRFGGDREAGGGAALGAIGEPDPFVARLALVVERADHLLGAG